MTTTETSEIQFPARVEYVTRSGRRKGKIYRVEREEHIPIAISRLIGMDTPSPGDWVFIRAGDSNDVQARLSADDLEIYLP